MPRAKYTGEEPAIKDIAFGTLFRLKIFMRHGGGKGSLGVVLAVDRGQRWDNYRRPLIVAFEGCPKGRYRLSPDDIDINSKDIGDKCRKIADEGIL